MTLGCASSYTAEVTDLCGGQVMRTFPGDDLVSVAWTRRALRHSIGEVVIAGCDGFVAEPGWQSLRLYRDGVPVWFGPIMTWAAGTDETTVRAVDWWWFLDKKRLVTTGYPSSKAIIEARLAALGACRPQVIGDIAFSNPLSSSLSTGLASAFTGAGATATVVNGSIVTYDANPPTAGALATTDLLGEVIRERTLNDPSLFGQQVTQFSQFTANRVLALPPERRAPITLNADNVTIAPDAPINIGDLVPGVLFDVRGVGTLRLVDVNVSWDSGGETIGTSLTSSTVIWFGPRTLADLLAEIKEALEVAWV